MREVWTCEQKRSSGPVRTECYIQVEPLMEDVNFQEWNTWRSGLISAVFAASQLPGGGPLG